MTTATFIKKTFGWGSLHFQCRDKKHGSMQAAGVLELRVLHLAGNRKLTVTLREA